MAMRMMIEPISPSNDDDASLVEAVRRRQSGAATLVYRRHADAVHALLFRRLGPQPDLEDLLQDIFASAFGSIDKLREPAALRSWLLSITVGRLRTYNRGRRRNWWLTYTPLDQMPEPATTHDEHHTKLFIEVRSLLEQLPPDERAALVLHRVQGLSLSESAEASGMSISTFKRRLSRGESRFFANAARRPTLAPWLAASDEASP
jgi:RNA polymerase sigma-70 factor (ECF subfamily)